MHFGFTKLVVADLERSVAFYTEALGLVEDYRVASQIAGRPIEQVAFAATAPDGPVLVLLRYADAPGPASGEVIVGFRVDDVESVCTRVVAAGGAVHREPQTMRRYGVVTAFLTDPEGHLIELVQPI